jgi:hypothetical protein
MVAGAVDVVDLVEVAVETAAGVDFVDVVRRHLLVAER